MTIDDLAAAAQQEFQAIRSEMATKDDIKTVLHAIEGIDMHLSAHSSRWSEDFSKLHDWVQELDGRLRVIEKQK
jgi:hypothetical protein